MERAESVASGDIVAHSARSVQNSSRNKSTKNLFFPQPR
jgi:hypothetical protein